LARKTRGPALNARATDLDITAFRRYRSESSHAGSTPSFAATQNSFRRHWHQPESIRWRMTYYSGGYAPAYYGHRYRRVVRPAYAYYGGTFPRRHFYHHRW